MSYSYDKFLKPLAVNDRNIQILDDNGNIIYTVNPFSILNLLVVNNLLRIDMKAGKDIAIAFSSKSEAKEALIRIQPLIDYLTLKTPYNISKDIENYIEERIYGFNRGFEFINDLSNATSSNLICDLSTSNIWYNSNINTNFTINFTNLPTTDNILIKTTILINVGSTTYSINNVQISEINQTVKWNVGATPSGYSNKVNEYVFTLLKSGGIWSLLGESNNFG